MLSPESPAKINSFYYQRSPWNTRGTQKPTLIDAVDGGSGIIGSHVAKLILYTRLLHRWAWATRNNLWKRSWHDTESDPVNENTVIHSVTSDFHSLYQRQLGFQSRWCRIEIWGGARWGVKQSDISLPTMNGLVGLQAYVVLHVTKSQKSTSDIHCALFLAQCYCYSFLQLSSETWRPWVTQWRFLLQTRKNNTPPPPKRRSSPVQSE